MRYTQSVLSCFYVVVLMSVDYPSLDPSHTIRQALSIMIDTHTYTVQVADATLTIHHLLEATRQGHPTTTLRQVIHVLDKSAIKTLTPVIPVS